MYGGEDAGYVEETDYVPYPIFLRLGSRINVENVTGSWKRTSNREFAISTQANLPFGLRRKMDGIATLSGNELTGRATVELLKPDGSVIRTMNAAVTGEKQ
jgi:hypothetical protein